MIKVVLIHPSVAPPDIPTIKGSSSVWMMYGESFSDYEKWNNYFEAKEVSRFELERGIEKTLQIEMDAMSNKIVELYKASKQKEDEFWLSPFVEKNGWPPMYVVQKSIFKTIMDQMRANQSEVIYVISSSRYILSEMKKHPSVDNEYNLTIIGKCFFWGSFAGLYIDVVFEFFALLKKVMVERLYFLFFFRSSRVNKKNTYVLLRTSPRNDSFQANGVFHDAYFPELKEKLEDANVPVLYQFNLSMVTNKKSAYNWLNKNMNGKVWALEEEVSTLDYLKGAFLSFKHIFFLHRIGGEVVDTLDSLYFSEYVQNYIKALVPKKIKQNGIKVSKIISFWENKAYEKYLCQKVRKYLPNCITIGYVHSIPFPFDPTCNYSKEEALITPMPDKIVTCGEYALDILKDKGVDCQRLSLGSALRFEYLRNIHVIPENAQYNKSIIVALPLDINLSSELLAFVYSFAKENIQLEFIVKPHPCLNPSYLERYSCSPLKNVRIETANYPLDKLFMRGKCFLYSGVTTLACEALILGKYVLKYVSKLYCTSDCLSFKFSSQQKLIYDNKDLLSLSVDKEHSPLNSGDGLLNYFFNLNSPRIIDCF